MGKTIAQKVFETHLVDKPFEGTYVLKLDRVFCHEITTPIAINDLTQILRYPVTLTVTEIILP